MKHTRSTAHQRVGLPSRRSVNVIINRMLCLFFLLGRLSDCADLLKRAMNLLHSSLGDRDVRLKLLAIT